MIIQHNMAAVNTMMQLGITNSKLKKATERLSSGYRVNRAADDAAALAISEKKRSQIRGLLRASKNAEDGIGFVQTGDGTMGQMEDILQRMRELTIQSLNDVYNEEDRAAMQMEFDQLQSEIDRMNDQTEFNKKNVFEHYADTYYKVEGNRVWCQDQIHTIDSSNQSLTIQYKVSDTEPEKTITFAIPAGEYTTQELIDEMDDVITGLNGADGLCLEYTGDGTCNMVIQDGVEITKLSGGLSYLFFDEFHGSRISALIGTTVFNPGYPLLVDNNNNELKFTIENFDGTTKKVDITIQPDRYSRSEMIDILNKELAGTGMTASENGEYSIQVGSDDGIITGLKGNMFKIDDESQGEKIRTSVFYDNTKYGSVQKTSGTFKGGAVLVNRSSDTECNHFVIDDTNNTLKIRVDGKDSDAYQEIVLDSGKYTIGEMVLQLQNKLDAAGVGVTVASYGPEVGNYTTNGNRYSFYGLLLTSKTDGTESKVEFDVAGSSAYQTLFVERRYTDEGKNPTPTVGKFEYQKASLVGGKSFSQTDFPLTLDNQTNEIKIRLTEKVPSGDSFVINEGTYAISLTEKTYHSLNELLTEINNKLNGPDASIGLKDKIQAVDNSGQIAFYPKDTNQTVTGIALEDSNARGLLFVGEKIEYNMSSVSSSGSSPSITLDTMQEPIQIDGSNNQMNVSVGGETRTVTIPAGSYTKDQLAEEITDQLKGKTTTTTNSFSGYGQGKTDDKNATYSETGKENRTKIDCKATGSGNTGQGGTAIINGKPASYTVPVALEAKTTITSANNQMTIEVNGNSYTIALDEGTYTPDELARALENKLMDVTRESDRVKVTTDSGKLVFSTVQMGSNVQMAFSADNSTFLDSISVTKTPASITTQPLLDRISIDGTNSSFTLMVDGKTTTISLDAGNYTRSDFIKQLNNKLKQNGIGVTASLNGSGLCLTTNEKGNGASIRYSTTQGGDSVSAMFGQLVKKEPAVASLKTPLKEPISITDTSNEFRVRLTKNGVPNDLCAVIPTGEYTKAQLVDKLNELYQGEVTVSLNSSGSLTFTSKDVGKEVSLRVGNSISSSAAKAMFGETTVKTPDVKASFDSQGRLVLTGEGGNGNYTLSVKPVKDSPFCKPKETIKKINPTLKEGKVTTVYHQIKTNADLPSTIKIQDYNKNLYFEFQTPSGVETVDFSLDERDYTQAELQNVLQEKLNAALGNGECSVSISGNRLTFKAAHYGADYKMENFSGGFYEYVMRGTAVRGSSQAPVKTDGKQTVTEAYIIGRKDVSNTTSKIQKDINDELRLDVTINNQVHTLSVTLDAGEYTAAQLIEQIQGKLDEAVKNEGLPEHLVLVDVGKFDTNVIGANDKNSLDLYINPDINLEPGSYRIDGLAGNALFEIFYKTEGKLEPAYLAGSKDISDGVTIEPQENEFSIDVDGVTYQYAIDAGEYTRDELIQKLNELFAAPDKNGNTAPITAKQSGDSLMFSYNKLGIHTINNFQGSAKAALFYEMGGRSDYSSELLLQIGANAGQMTDLERFSMSTINMGINSITITKHKYANKALDRLDGALVYLNSARSLYGAGQNRLEYTIKGNDNTAENLQASESRDRDADMADEMVEYSKMQILQQTGMAVLAQSKQQVQSVLQLLQ